MKRLGVLVLIAFAAVTLTASGAQATPITTLPTPISTALAGSGVKLNKLFKGANRTATSVSVTSSIGTLTILNPKASGVTAESGDFVVFTHNHNRQLAIVRLEPTYRPVPISSQPIPEARSVLLYALGSLAIGWTVLRSRKQSLPARA